MDHRTSVVAVHTYVQVSRILHSSLNTLPSEILQRRKIEGKIKGQNAINTSRQSISYAKNPKFYRSCHLRMPSINIVVSILPKQRYPQLCSPKQKGMINEGYPEDWKNNCSLQVKGRKIKNTDDWYIFHQY